MILCQYVTLLRYSKKYLHDEILPWLNNGMITRGRYPFVEDKDILLLNNSIPCRNTLMEYQYKATHMDNQISVVPTSALMPKTSRRKMVGTSVRNLMSHLCAIRSTHFWPSSEPWKRPRNLSKGAIDILEIAKKLVDTHLKLLKPHFLLNIDCSSMYYYEGV